MKYREIVKREYKKLMSRLEGCLQEYRRNRVSPKCQPLYATNFGRRSVNVNGEKEKFLGILNEFLQYPESSLAPFWKKYKNLDGVKKDNL